MTVILMLSELRLGLGLLWGDAVLVLTQMFPFVALGAVLLILPESFCSRRIACVAISGLLGILALLVPVYWVACRPHIPDSLEGVALMVVGLAASVPMLVGVAIGAGIATFVGRK
jgi:hypothetical protein